MKAAKKALAEGVPRSATRAFRGTDDFEDAPPLPAAIVNPKDGSPLRLIPAGQFTAGSTWEQIQAARRMDIYGHEFSLLEEFPQFQARLPAFYLSEWTVTNAQFSEFLNETQPPPEEARLLAPVLERITADHRARGNTHYRVLPGFDRHPVIHVSWFGARAYCQWAGLRLPTELEWEKAARGPDGRLYPWGNEWRDAALRWRNATRPGATTAPVDAFPEGRSPYGICQMAGNVDEWCEDWYQWDVYHRYAAGDLRPPVSGEMRVVRGGTCVGWQKLCFRCAHRRGNDPALVNILFTGIRCACDAPFSAGILPMAEQPGQPLTL